MNQISMTGSEFDVAAVQPFLERIELAAQAVLLREATPGDDCYVIDEGRVRIQVDRPDVDTDAVIAVIGPGSTCGELSFVDRSARSATAVADTDVRARRLTHEAFARLRAQHPAVALDLMTALAGSAAAQARRLSRHLELYVAPLQADPSADAVVARASAAQRAIGDPAAWPEPRLDGLLVAIGSSISRHAEELADLTMADTGIGNVTDKAIKIRFAAHDVVSGLLTTPGVGFRDVAGSTGVAEFAAPVGVILGLIPVTNPTSTLVFKALIALRSRNAIVLSPHRAAARVAQRTTELIREVLGDAGAPVDVVQCLPGHGSRTRTALFMRHPGIGLVLATGGTAMVKAAYSSGTPAIGVGSGNAPALVCADADLDAAADAIMSSKSFDHGLICGSENNLVVEAGVRDQFVDALRRAGAMVLDGEATGRLASVAFEDGRLRRTVLGQSASSIAAAAGLDAPDGVRVLVAPVDRAAVDGPWGREKLAPLLSLFEVAGPDDGFALCRAILEHQGAGHTAVIHTASRERQLRFTSSMPASRIISNGPAAQGCIGLGNGLTPSLTLGCGTDGGTSTSDNVTASHLLNVRRLVSPRTPVGHVGVSTLTPTSTAG